MTYLVAYDIANPRRLQRVARFLERNAVRCQKSVFLFHGDAVAIEQLLNQLAPLLQPTEDCVQARRQKAEGRRQKAEGRRQKADLLRCKFLWVSEHASQHFADLKVTCCQFLVGFLGEVAAIASEIEPDLRFGRFSI